MTPVTRAIRGATTVDTDAPDEIREAVAELVDALMQCNDLDQDRIISAFFTMSGDLVSAFPATAAREDRWPDVPMLCAVEIPVPGAQPRCIRVLVHAMIAAGRPVRHVYLREAAALRPDLALPGVSAVLAR